MSRKTKTHPKEKDSAIPRAPKSKARAAKDLAQRPGPAQLLMQALNAPSTLTPSDILALQQATGNRAVQGILRELPHRSSTPMNTVQRKTEEEDPLQRKIETTRKEENSTGLPHDLKAGIENLSGIAMDDVRVHYNSPLPAKVQASAFTRGTDIYVGPNEEKHLPHEAWHVVQQKQGRVKPTLQPKGVAINDDQGLEREADAMGEKATKAKSMGLQAQKPDGSNSLANLPRRQPAPRIAQSKLVIQPRVWMWKNGRWDPMLSDAEKKRAEFKLPAPNYRAGTYTGEVYDDEAEPAAAAMPVAAATPAAIVKPYTYKVDGHQPKHYKTSASYWKMASTKAAEDTMKNAIQNVEKYIRLNVKPWERTKPNELFYLTVDHDTNVGWDKKAKKDTSRYTIQFEVNKLTSEITYHGYPEANGMLGLGHKEGERGLDEE